MTAAIVAGMCWFLLCSFFWGALCFSSHRPPSPPPFPFSLPLSPSLPPPPLPPPPSPPPPPPPPRPLDGAVNIQLPGFLACLCLCPRVCVSVECVRWVRYAIRNACACV